MHGSAQLIKWLIHVDKKDELLLTAPYHPLSPNCMIVWLHHSSCVKAELRQWVQGFGPARALTITAVPEPKPASPRWDARKHGGGTASRFRGFKEEERLEKKAKRIWTWCQVTFLAFQGDPCHCVSKIDEWRSLLLQTLSHASLGKQKCR